MTKLLCGSMARCRELPVSVSIQASSLPVVPRLSSPCSFTAPCVSLKLRESTVKSQSVSLSIQAVEFATLSRDCEGEPRKWTEW